MIGFFSRKKLHFTAANPSPQGTPLGLDLAYYRKSYKDVAHFSDAQLCAHYRDIGRKEGRVGAANAQRAHFVAQIKAEPSVLEIGPFLNPCVSGPNVSYFEVLDAPALVARAKAVNYPTIKIPTIDFVSPTGDLAVVDRNFAAVVSSHCIEHQPDLVAHLQQVERILAAGGRYFLLIPDKRYCFDQSLAESNLAEVLAAHRARHKVHQLESVIEHRALTTHNYAVRHWRGDHYDAGWEGTVAERTQAAIAEFEAAEGGYVDVHAWQFTPASFAFIVQNLRKMGLIGLDLEQAYDTPRDQLEFTAVLRKPAAR